MHLSAMVSQSLVLTTSRTMQFDICGCVKAILLKGKNNVLGLQQNWDALTMEVNLYNHGHHYVTDYVTTVCIFPALMKHMCAL